MKVNPKIVPAFLLAAVLAGGITAALAVNASAPLLPGDRLHGDIPAPGDSDLLTIYLPAGTLFSVDVLAESGSAILPGLVATDPADEVMDLTAFTTPGPKGVGLKVRNASAGPLGGTFSFEPVATGTSSGKYSFRLTAKMPKKTFGDLTVPTGLQGEFTFDAPSGSKLAWSIQPPKGVDPAPFTASLRAPSDAVTPLGALSGKKRALDADGTWALLVDNGSGTDTTFAVTVTLTLPKASTRQLYLSADGFGTAPKVKSVDPKKVLDDRVAVGVAIVGEGFDPAAEVRLEKSGKEPIPASNLVIADAGHITADFDVVGAPTGGWKVVVENPSGGRGTFGFTVKAAGSVQLPTGLRAETEVWWLDIKEPEFRDDLAAMGLSSSNLQTAALSEAAVKSYMIYWLRLAFGLDPTTGKTQEGSVYVSFCLSAPPSTTGTPGTTYNRLEIGGAAVLGDPSTNPNYPWGSGPLDTGNAVYDDVGREVSTGLGIRTAALAPTLAGSTGGYLLGLKPLIDLPLGSADQKYYFQGFSPASAAEGARYRDIVIATDTAGRELAGTIAHFVARAMGTADSAMGLSLVPTKVGEYATLSSFSFTQGESAAMAAAVLAGLPGKASTLRADYFGLRDTMGYTLPNATSTKAYSQYFIVAGGRPERVALDLEFIPVSGNLPAGISFLATGGLSGTSPLRYPDNTLVGGLYRFAYRMRDTVTGDVLFVGHRLNMLVDTANPALTPNEVTYGNQLNMQTLNTPN